MKLKDLIEKYGEYELYTDSPKHIENAFKDLDSKDDEVLCLYVKKTKPKTVWDLKENDTFFVLTSDGKILYYKFGCYNNHEIECGSAFLTYTEAEQNLERRKVETLLLKHGGRRWFKRFGENFGFLIDDVHRIGIHSLNQIQGTIYFDTYSDAETAIEQIGEKRLKEALFEVR